MTEKIFFLPRRVRYKMILKPSILLLWAIKNVGIILLHAITKLQKMATIFIPP